MVHKSFTRTYFRCCLHIECISFSAAQGADRFFDAMCHSVLSAMATLIVSGDEWDYVIMSTVRSMPRYEIDKRSTFSWLKMNLTVRSLPEHGINSRPTIGWRKINMGFITDENQTNVALTRAKKGPIIIGEYIIIFCHV